MDLPIFQNTDVVGKAVTFISHSWDEKFGDLIAAISDGADYSRRVWVDIFAVRQWPSTKSDLAFEVVIKCVHHSFFSVLKSMKWITGWEYLCMYNLSFLFIVFGVCMSSFMLP